MINKGEKILVAFSGGCDSVCLALALNSLGYEIGLAHVNHNLRDSAKNEAEFCENFAKSLSVPFYLASPDVKGYAEEKKVSIETAGRILRYEFFESVKGYEKIATAHHKNDCAETVVQHLTRGSGLKGLTGILPVRGKFIRPLINLTRNEIEKTVEDFGAKYCTDESNFSDHYSRNRIRLNVIPLLEQENEKAVDNICKTASLLQSDEEFLTSLAKNELNGECEIEVSHLKSLPYPIAYRILRIMFENAAGTAKDFEMRHAEYILSHLKEHGEILDLPFEVTAFASYGKLLFAKKEFAEEYCHKLSIGENIFENLNLKITLKVSDKKPDSGIYLDSKKLSFGDLYLRSPKETDYFVPFGAKGGKNLSKVLIDLKIPKQKRASVPLIATNTEIISIVNKKRSASFSCDEATTDFLIIQEENIHE